MGAGGKTKRKSLATATELPEEVLRKEILTRLPIKSVVRFKCVSKSWLSLFSDLKFVKEHHTRNATQNPHDYDCLIANKDRAGIFILSRYKEAFAIPSDDYQVIGSIHGLVCLHVEDKLSLWNPAIRQSKELTLPPRRYGDVNNIGLGFDPASNDYKVVVCYTSLASSSRYAIVYSSNSDSWTDVFVPDYVFCPDRSSHPVTIVKNCPYWSCTRYSSRKMRVKMYLAAVRFDVGRNEFILLPEFHTNLSDECGNCFQLVKYYEFVNMKDRLTLMMYRPSPNSMVDVYSFDEEGWGVWSKVYSVGPLDLYTQCWELSQGFKYGGEIVFHDERVFCCYDHKTGTIKRLLRTTSTTFCVRSCFTYTPSLVFIQGMKSVYSQTQSRTPGLYSRTPRRLISSLRAT